jgi:hypothetical protein
MLFTQAAKLEPRFCSGDYRPFLATPKLRFPCSFVMYGDDPENALTCTISLSKNHLRIECCYSS